MLRSEVYRGNYLYQKFYTKDVLEKKTARNKGQLPQYFIENHHEVIIPSDDWERVQVLLQHRSELRDQRERKKHPAHTGKNAAFESFFRCGECGSVIGHRRYFTGEREMNGWICIDAARAYARERCTGTRFQQKYLELHFMHMLVGIKREKGFHQELQAWYERTDLGLDERRRIHTIKEEIASLSQKLYSLVEGERQQAERNVQAIDVVTGRMVQLQEELRTYSERSEKTAQMRQEMKWLDKQLQELDAEGVLDYRNVEKNVPFRADIFSRLLVKGTITANGRVVYEWSNGMRWGTEMEYQEYLDMVQQNRAAVRQKKRMDFLHGPAVQEMLEFCSEARSLGELLTFMNERVFISEPHLRKSVLNPLLAEGKLVRLFPNKNSHPKQRFYSPKHNTVYDADVEIVKGDFSEENLIRIARQVVLDPDEVKAILEYCRIARSRRELQDLLGLKDRNHIRKRILNPLIEWGMLQYTHPEWPSCRQQKYLSEME